MRRIQRGGEAVADALIAKAEAFGEASAEKVVDKIEDVVEDAGASGAALNAGFADVKKFIAADNKQIESKVEAMVKRLDVANMSPKEIEKVNKKLQAEVRKKLKDADKVLVKLRKRSGDAALHAKIDEYRASIHNAISSAAAGSMKGGSQLLTGGFLKMDQEIIDKFFTSAASVLDMMSYAMTEETSPELKQQQYDLIAKHIEGLKHNPFAEETNKFAHDMVGDTLKLAFDIGEKVTKSVLFVFRKFGEYVNLIGDAEAYIITLEKIQADARLKIQADKILADEKLIAEARKVLIDAQKALVDNVKKAEAAKKGVIGMIKSLKGWIAAAYNNIVKVLTSNGTVLTITAVSLLTCLIQLIMTIDSLYEMNKPGIAGDADAWNDAYNKFFAHLLATAFSGSSAIIFGYIAQNRAIL
jgi:Mg2+ and Co2+ transporter CorA